MYLQLQLSKGYEDVVDEWDLIPC